MKIAKVSTALLAMFLGGTVAFAQPTDGSASAQVRKTSASRAHVLSRAEVDELLEQPGKVLIIDVRRPDEISAIGGFPVYLSIQLKDLRNSLAWIPRDRILVAVSNHAGRASRAADILTGNGFRVAGVAGAQLYEKEGGVLTKIAIPPPRTRANAVPRKAG